MARSFGVSIMKLHHFFKNDNGAFVSVHEDKNPRLVFQILKGNMIRRRNIKIVPVCTMWLLKPQRKTTVAKNVIVLLQRV